MCVTGHTSHRPLPQTPVRPAYIIRALLKPAESPVHLTACRLPSALLAEDVEKLSIRAWLKACRHPSWHHALLI